MRTSRTCMKYKSISKERAKNETAEASMNYLLFAFRIIRMVSIRYFVSVSLLETFQRTCTCTMRSRNWPFTSGRSANCQPCIAQRQINSFDDYKLKILDEGICNGRCGGREGFGVIILPLTFTTFVVSVRFDAVYCFVRRHVWFFFQAYSIQIPFKFAFWLKSNFNYFQSVHCMRMCMDERKYPWVLIEKAKYVRSVCVYCIHMTS